MLVAVSCLALLVGCGDTTPAGESTTAPAGLPDDYTVPAVAEPLEPGTFVADPCSLLTSEQRTELELPVAENEESLGLVKCVLGAERDPLRPVTLQILIDNSLAGLVAQCRSEHPPAACATWTPTTVEEYPAVLDTGNTCRLTVAVTDDKVLLVNDLPESPCQRVVTIATLSLAALRVAR